MLIQMGQIQQQMLVLDKSTWLVSSEIYTDISKQKNAFLHTWLSCNRF